jgi:hypothetical protein
VVVPSWLTFASSDCNWLTFTASVPFNPAATFVMRRPAPAAPTDTSPAAVAADSVPLPGLYAAEPSVVEFATEPAPSATEFVAVAVALLPITTVPTVVEDAA